jgi:hypothetical protein
MRLSESVNGRGLLIGRPVKLAAGINAAALVACVAASAGAGGLSRPVRHPAVHPTLGGLTTIVRVEVVADSLGAFDSDELEVAGPSGTPCAGDLIAGSGVIHAPGNDGGPVTLYIGPAAAERYPAMALGGANDLWVSARRLTRWCSGTYTGKVLYDSGTSLPPVLTTSFQFRISANTRVGLTPAPAVARALRPVTVAPRRGRGSSVFTVRYRADAAPYSSGDVIEVDGPKGSACRGGLARLPSARAGEHAGLLSAHIGPGAGQSFRWGAEATTASPAPNNGIGKPLRRWCSGTYNGTIFYERGPKFTVVARFKLRVRP